MCVYRTIEYSVVTFDFRALTIMDTIGYNIKFCRIQATVCIYIDLVLFSA
jgi:hypothetical protein